jgi:hypothetical protein
MFSNMSYRANCRLTTAESAALRRYLTEHGHAQACESIGIVKGTAYRALAGDSVSRGTLALIRMALAPAGALAAAFAVAANASHLERP